VTQEPYRLGDLEKVYIRQAIARLRHLDREADRELSSLLQGILDRDARHHNKAFTVTVAFTVLARTMRDAQNWLMGNLLPDEEFFSQNKESIDNWYIAEDERYDGSDYPSAVYVPMGQQAEVRYLLDSRPHAAPKKEGE
jgi:hypothetical protein